MFLVQLSHSDYKIFKRFTEWFQIRNWIISEIKFWLSNHPEVFTIEIKQILEEQKDKYRLVEYIEDFFEVLYTKNPEDEWQKMDISVELVEAVENFYFKIL